MIQMITEMLSYPFLVRAIIVGLLVALCASLLGVSLVLKRFSMIGDGLSHVGFGALAIASVANIAPLALAIPVCIAASFLLPEPRPGGLPVGDRGNRKMDVSPGRGLRCRRRADR